MDTINENGQSVTVTVPNDGNNGWKHRKKQLYSSIKKYLWIFPLYSSISIVLIIVVPYTTSAYYGYTGPIYPLVSDSGGYPPGASILSLLFIFEAIFATLTSWFRYKQVKYYLQSQSKDDQNANFSKKLRSINWNLVTIMIFFTFGVIIFTTFRSTESIIMSLIHAFAAALAVMCLALYLLGTIYTCWYLYKVYNIESLPISLIVSTSIQLIAITTFTMTFFMSIYLTGMKFFDPNFRLKWPDNETRTLYLVATISETISILLLSLLNLCLFNRMRKFKDWDKIRF
uniref:Uncharacterized protein LOC113791849 n=1 Tax=Dermatophagoides pteronyssinus TaxID=6956 RepID=A0A6P6XWB1_DERPT|nr:uncharacterized protein LOC113791849 [Dermatophagoides pteronyssinus]